MPEAERPGLAQRALATATRRACLGFLGSLPCRGPALSRGVAPGRELVAPTPCGVRRRLEPGELRVGRLGGRDVGSAVRFERPQVLFEPSQPPARPLDGRLRRVDLGPAPPLPVIRLVGRLARGQM
ncbi:MAG TPA: hypothetical protein VNT23_06790 [Gaiellaceae bacterium]|nr:hypothetical protein [Gaiellaceae bacterium]